MKEVNVIYDQTHNRYFVFDMGKVWSLIQVCENEHEYRKFIKDYKVEDFKIYEIV